MHCISIIIYNIFNRCYKKQKEKQYDILPQNVLDQIIFPPDQYDLVTRLGDVFNNNYIEPNKLYEYNTSHIL
jgi:hypothetical protein